MSLFTFDLRRNDQEAHEIYGATRLFLFNMVKLHDPILCDVYKCMAVNVGCQC